MVGDCPAGAAPVCAFFVGNVRCTVTGAPVLSVTNFDQVDTAYVPRTPTRTRR